MTQIKLLIFFSLLLPLLYFLPSFSFPFPNLFFLALFPFFARANYRKSSSSVFLCSLTPRIRLLRGFFQVTFVCLLLWRVHPPLRTEGGGGGIKSTVAIPFSLSLVGPFSQFMHAFAELKTLQISWRRHDLGRICKFDKKNTSRLSQGGEDVNSSATV